MMIVALAALAGMMPMQDHSAHAGHDAAQAPAALTLDTPVAMLAANPAAKVVLDKHFPQMLSHPMYDQFKQMSLKQLQPLAQGQITNDMLAAAEKDLAAIR